MKRKEAMNTIVHAANKKNHAPQSKVLRAMAIGIAAALTLTSAPATAFAAETDADTSTSQVQDTTTPQETAVADLKDAVADVKEADAAVNGTVAADGTETAGEADQVQTTLNQVEKTTDEAETVSYQAPDGTSVGSVAQQAASELSGITDAATGTLTEAEAAETEAEDSFSTAYTTASAKVALEAAQNSYVDEKKTLTDSLANLQNKAAEYQSATAVSEQIDEIVNVVNAGSGTVVLDDDSIDKIAIVLGNSGEATGDEIEAEITQLKEAVSSYNDALTRYNHVYATYEPSVESDETAAETLSKQLDAGYTQQNLDATAKLGYATGDEIVKSLISEYVSSQYGLSVSSVTKVDSEGRSTNFYEGNDYFTATATDADGNTVMYEFNYHISDTGKLTLYTKTAGAAASVEYLKLAEDTIGELTSATDADGKVVYTTVVNGVSCPVTYADGKYTVVYNGKTYSNLSAISSRWDEAISAYTSDVYQYALDYASAQKIKQDTATQAQLAATLEESEAMAKAVAKAAVSSESKLYQALAIYYQGRSSSLDSTGSNWANGTGNGKLSESVNTTMAGIYNQLNGTAFTANDINQKFIWTITKSGSAYTINWSARSTETTSGSSNSYLVYQITTDSTDGSVKSMVTTGGSYVADKLNTANAKDATSQAEAAEKAVESQKTAAEAMTNAVDEYQTYLTKIIDASNSLKKAAADKLNTLMASLSELAQARTSESSADYLEAVQQTLDAAENYSTALADAADSLTDASAAEEAKKAADNVLPNTGNVINAITDGGSTTGGSTTGGSTITPGTTEEGTGDAQTGSGDTVSPEDPDAVTEKVTKEPATTDTKVDIIGNTTDAETETTPNVAGTTVSANTGAQTGNTSQPAATTTTTSTQDTAVAGTQGATDQNTSTIDENKVPLADSEDTTSNQDTTTLEDQDVPLTDHATQQKQQNFWWWILLVIAGAFGVGTYAKKKNDAAKAVETDKDKKENR